MSGWRKAMAYLGLVDEVDEEFEAARRAQRATARAGATTPQEPSVRLARGEAVPGAGEIDLREAARSTTSTAEPPPALDATARLELPAEPPAAEPDNVRPLRPVGRRRAPRGPETTAHVAVVAVDQFDAVEAVAVRLREREAVVLDLSTADKTTARRVLDFVSGAVFVVDARLQPLGNRAFLVLPRGVEMSSNERRRLSNLGYRVGLEQVGLA